MRTLMLLVVLAIAAPALATTITFEPGTDTLGWGSSIGYLQPISESLYQTNYSNTTEFPSGDYAVYNAYGYQSFFVDGPLSNVDGVWASTLGAHDGWYDPYSAHQILVLGFNSGAWVGSVTWNLTPEFQYFPTGFTAPVDSLALHTLSQTPQWFLLDDLTLTVLPGQVIVRDPVGGDPGANGSTTPAVPEPETWLLLLIGFVIVGWFNLKRRVLI